MVCIFRLSVFGVFVGSWYRWFHITANLGWVDAFLNASMILTGMGPVDKLETETAKVFASLYAIFSGVAFLTFCGVLFTPIYHRFIHKFHLDLGEKNL